MRMTVNPVERDFLKLIRSAKAEVVKPVVDYLSGLKEKESKGGTLSEVGLLTAGICEELVLNGMVKFRNIEER